LTDFGNSILVTCLFICQGTSIRRQRRDLFGHRVKLFPVTTVWLLKS